MAAKPRAAGKRRPVYLNLPAIRQPIPAIASILHRISGALLFVVGLPALLWGMQATLSSAETHAAFRSALASPLAKIIVLALVWAYLQHLFAGFRHLLQDMHVGLELKPARQSATVVVVAAVLVTMVLGIRVW